MPVTGGSRGVTAAIVVVPSTISAVAQRFWSADYAISQIAAAQQAMTTDIGTAFPAHPATGMELESSLNQLQGGIQTISNLCSAVGNALIAVADAYTNADASAAGQFPKAVAAPNGVTIHLGRGA